MRKLIILVLVLSGFISKAQNLPVYGDLDVFGATYVRHTLLVDSNAIFISNVGIGTTSPQTKLHVVDVDSVFYTDYSTYNQHFYSGLTIQKTSSPFDIGYTGIIDNYVSDLPGYAGILNQPSAGNLREARLGFMDTLNGKGYGVFVIDMLGGTIYMSDTNATGLNATYQIGNKWGIGIGFGDPILAKLHVDGEGVDTSAYFTGGMVVINDDLQISDGTQVKDYILTSDASGNATWQDPTAYGEMGFGDSSVTVALTQNVWAHVTNSGNDLWVEGVVDTHNVTYSADSLIINKMGVYAVNVQLSMDGTNGSTLELGIYINGSLACTCVGVTSLANNRVVQLSYTNIDGLRNGDIIQVMVRNTQSNDDVDVLTGKIALNKVGN